MGVNPISYFEYKNQGGMVVTSESEAEILLRQFTEISQINKIYSYHCAIYYTIIHYFNRLTIFWSIVHNVDLTNLCGIYTNRRKSGFRRVTSAQLSVVLRYKTITEYRFGRPATDENRLS